MVGLNLDWRLAPVMALYYCEVCLMSVRKVSPVLLVIACAAAFVGGAPSLAAKGAGTSASSASTPATPAKPAPPLAEFGVNKDGEFDPQLAAKQYATASNKAFSQAQAKEKAGNLKDAEQLYRKSLQYREQIWGKADPGVIRLYEIIGGLSHKRDALDEAERCYRIVLMAGDQKVWTGEL